MNVCAVHGVWGRLAAVVIAWLCLVLTQQAECQEPRIAGSTRATKVQAVAPAANAASVRGPCDPDYWIVSARCCEQQLRCGQNCEFAVYRFDGPGCRTSSLSELYGSLQPGVPVCFMVHGSFVLWDSMLRDSAETYRWLRNAAPERPVQMVFFTWPSDARYTLIPASVDACDARRLGRLAELNSLYLAELVSHVPEANPVCLMGHSHGARMVSATLHLLGGGLVQGFYFAGAQQYRQRIRTVLAAAAMDHDWFNPGERFEMALCRTESMIHFRNRHDLPLVFHPTHHLFATPALGRVGITESDHWSLGQTSCRVSECDVTDLIGLGHVWSHYYNQPAIASAMKDYVYFSDDSAGLAATARASSSTLPITLGSTGLKADRWHTKEEAPAAEPSYKSGRIGSPR